MKKLIVFSVLCVLLVCAIGLGLSACGGNTPKQESELGYKIDFETVYAFAEEAGYRGTMEDLIAAFKGEKGDPGENGRDGQTPTIEIDEDGFWVINGTKSNVKAAGEKGANGAAGNGISKIEKTATEDLTDTYTITFTDGTTFDFTVTNGINKSAVQDSNAPTPDDYFRFKLLEDDNYEIYARYVDMPTRTILPSIHNGKPVVKIAKNGFGGRLSLEEVVIPNSVTEIGENSFAGCVWLSACEIPAGATVGLGAFEDTQIHYSLTTQTNLIGAGTYTQKNSELVNVGNTFVLSAQAIDGYVFIGWYLGDEVFSLSGAESEFQMPACDLVLTACFEPLKKLSTDSNLPEAGFFTKLNEKEYRAGTLVVLTASPNAGYVFLGWYNGEERLTKNPMLLFNMPSDDVTYTAKFQVCEHESLTGCLCSLCGALLHDYSDGTCTRCGDKLIQRVDVEGKISAEGNYLLFGTYLQSKVTNESVVNALSSRAGLMPSNDQTYAWRQDASRYYYYQDLSYENANYRGIYQNSVLSWYKYEPIKWRILSEDGGTAFVLCESILDARRFDDDSNNYKDSEIRAYLNMDLYNRAFAAAQQALIQITTVDNSPASTGYDPNLYACEDTNDKIFLLSYAELTNASYGFNGASDAKKQPTDYAIANDIQVNNEGFGSWWYRSPNQLFGSNIACAVTSDGYIAAGNNFDSSCNGIVPALKISLS